MKFKVELEAEDFLEEVPNYENFDTHYRFKDQEEFEDYLKESLIEEIKGKLGWKLNHLKENEIFKEFLNENKKEIIDRVIDKAYKSILHSKVINDFKKQLDEEMK